MSQKPKGVHWKKIFVETPQYVQPGPSLPEYPHNSISFAGERVVDQGSEYERVKNSFVGIVESAKDVHLESGVVYPWQRDRKGLLFSTHVDVLEMEIDALRKKLKLKPLSDAKPLDWEPVNEDVLPKPKPKKSKVLKDQIAEMKKIQDTERWLNPNRSILFNKLINRELKLYRALRERKFRKNLRNWIVGEGPASEYDTCFWVNQKKAHDKDERVAWEEKQKMVRKTPGITKGFIDDLDSTPTKIGMFLSMLKSKMPVTEEEAYLYYKYIVKKVPVNTLDVEDYFKRPPPPSGGGNPPPPNPPSNNNNDGPPPSNPRNHYNFPPYPDTSGPPRDQTFQDRLRENRERLNRAIRSNPNIDPNAPEPEPQQTEQNSDDEYEDATDEIIEVDDTDPIITLLEGLTEQEKDDFNQIRDEFMEENPGEIIDPDYLLRKAFPDKMKELDDRNKVIKEEIKEEREEPETVAEIQANIPTAPAQPRHESPQERANKAAERRAKMAKKQRLYPVLRKEPTPTAPPAKIPPPTEAQAKAKAKANKVPEKKPEKKVTYMNMSKGIIDGKLSAEELRWKQIQKQNKLNPAPQPNPEPEKEEDIMQEIIDRTEKESQKEPEREEKPDLNELIEKMTKSQSLPKPQPSKEQLEKLQDLREEVNNTPPDNGNDFAHYQQLYEQEVQRLEEEAEHWRQELEEATEAQSQQLQQKLSQSEAELARLKEERDARQKTSIQQALKDQEEAANREREAQEQIARDEMAKAEEKTKRKEEKRRKQEKIQKELDDKLEKIRIEHEQQLEQQKKKEEELRKENEAMRREKEEAQKKAKEANDVAIKATEDAQAATIARLNATQALIDLRQHQQIADLDSLPKPPPNPSASKPQKEGPSLAPTTPPHQFVAPAPRPQNGYTPLLNAVYNGLTNAVSTVTNGINSGISQLNIPHTAPGAPNPPPQRPPTRPTTPDFPVAPTNQPTPLQASAPPQTPIVPKPISVVIPPKLPPPVNPEVQKPSAPPETPAIIQEIPPVVPNSPDSPKSPEKEVEKISQPNNQVPPSEWVPDQYGNFVDQQTQLPVVPAADPLLAPNLLQTEEEQAEEPESLTEQEAKRQNLYSKKKKDNAEKAQKKAKAGRKDRITDNRRHGEKRKNRENDNTDKSSKSSTKDDSMEHSNLEQVPATPKANFEESDKKSRKAKTKAQIEKEERLAIVRDKHKNRHRNLNWKEEDEALYKKLRANAKAATGLKDKELTHYLKKNFDKWTEYGLTIAEARHLLLMTNWKTQIAPKTEDR